MKRSTLRLSNEMDMDVDIETMIDMKIGMENEEAFVCELCYMSYSYCQH